MLVTILTSHVWDIFFLDWVNLLNNNYTTFKLINSLFFRPVNYDKKLNSWAATIAQWISQRLPSLALGSNPKHNIYAFSIHTVQILYSSFESECKKNKNKQKETRNDPFKKTLSTLTEGNCFEQKMWFEPVISSSTSGSIIGKMLTRSLTKNGPAGWIWSDLNVPELSNAKSAFVAATF